MLNSRALWWSLLIVWIAASTYWHLCKILELCSTDLTIIVAEASTPIIREPFVISDSSRLTLHSKGNFAFAKGGIIADKSDVYPQMDALAIYMGANPGKLLTITGYYSSKEINNTIFPNLGLARANDIKNWLRGKRVPDTAFLLKGLKKENIIFINDSLQGGIHFSFSDKLISKSLENDKEDKENVKAVTEELAKYNKEKGKEKANGLVSETKNEIISKPVDIYFTASSKDYIKTSRNQKFLDEAVKYLSKNKNGKLTLIVHAGGETVSEAALALSENRINNLKGRFIEFGIPAQNIIVKKRMPQSSALGNSSEGKYASGIITVVVK
ncbi:hypothetical protein [Dyadobacter sp. NIV53]|uniref:hypothetical protein n=1 Tax=Dyadobacter sp. NIV53 TaxID=2861765 RepID=UPI001C88A32C|nr:hypothetical protein [Dyadobacter sp. NIV53]